MGMFDALGEDLCPYSEFRSFCQKMLGDGKTGNLDAALKTIQLNHLDKFSFKDLVTMNRKYPYALYPVFAIRIHMMRSTFGETWWEQTHYRVADLNRLKAKIEKGNKEAMKEKMKIEENNEVLNRMGWLKFTFMPWERNKVRMQIMKVKQLAAQMGYEEFQEEMEEKQ